MGVSKTNDHNQIKIKRPSLNQDLPASSKAPNEDLRDMDVLCTFKIKIEIQNLENKFPNNLWPYPNHDQDVKPQWGTSSILYVPKSGLKGYRCSLHLENQESEPIFETWVYEKPVTISKSRSQSQTPVRNLQHSPKPQIRTWRTWMFFEPSK